MKILIIEDEKIAAGRLKRLLIEINEGVEIMAVCQGIQDSIDFLQTQHPDVIICDIHLQDGDVFALIKQMKKAYKFIFISAENNQVAEAYKVNPIDFLLKPIKINELKEAIIKTKNNMRKPMSPILGMQNFRFNIAFKIGSRYSTIRARQTNYYYFKDKLIIDINRDLKTYPLRFTLKTLIEHLDDRFFIVLDDELIIALDSIRKRLNLTRQQVKLVLHPSLDSDLIYKKHELMCLNKRLASNDQLNVA